MELPLTSLADDAERTRKMIAQVDGPVLLVGHSHGGAVISEAGDRPNVVGLVYIAAFAPDARKIIRLDAGHASLASQPEAVSALIDEAATALA